MNLHGKHTVPGAIGCSIGVLCSLTFFNTVFARTLEPPLHIQSTPTLVPTILPSPTIEPSPTPTNTPKPTSIPTPRPTITPKPTIRPFSADDLNRWFDTYSKQYSIDIHRLKSIADCESHTNPSSSNGFYGGMFQYSVSSWRSARIQMNKNPDPTLRFDPEAAIETASFTISTRGAGAWPSCGNL